MQDRLTYTVTEVAEVLGISRAAAYECIHRGEIPALTLGRRIVVARAALEALLGPATAGPLAGAANDANGERATLVVGSEPARALLSVGVEYRERSDDYEVTLSGLDVTLPFVGDEAVTIVDRSRPLWIVHEADEADLYRGRERITSDDGREWVARVIDGHEAKPPTWWVVRGVEPADHLA